MAFHGAGKASVVRGFGTLNARFMMALTSSNDPSTNFLIYISSKPKIDVCILLTPARAFLLRFIYTLRSGAFFLYCLTSSSDQKSNDFRQNTSTMLGLFVFASATNGKQNIGSEPSVTFVIFSSLSSAISICLPLLAHSV